MVLGERSVGAVGGFCRQPIKIRGFCHGETLCRVAGDGKASSQLRLAREVGLRAAAGRGSNFIVSPLSIHGALALVATGARGETRQELLGFLESASLDELHDAAWLGLVGKLNGLTQTSFACGVWADRGHELQSEFMATVASRYAATAESVDFSLEAEKARRRVNAFVEDATNGLVRDVLPPGSVDSTTVFVLANALYFKGTHRAPPQAAFYYMLILLPDDGRWRQPCRSLRPGGHDAGVHQEPHARRQTRSRPGGSWSRSSSSPSSSRRTIRPPSRWTSRAPSPPQQRPWSCFRVEARGLRWISWRIGPSCSPLSRRRLVLCCSLAMWSILSLNEHFS
ncbi:hypothetical protein ACQ4PT_027870 [Festuca glaucescens]